MYSVNFERKKILVLSFPKVDEFFRKTVFEGL